MVEPTFAPIGHVTSPHMASIGKYNIATISATVHGHAVVVVMDVIVSARLVLGQERGEAATDGRGGSLLYQRDRGSFGVDSPPRLRVSVRTCAGRARRKRGRTECFVK